MVGLFGGISVEHDQEWLIKAYEFARRHSQDPRTQVGAVLVDKQGNRLASGANGLPHGVTDKPERWISPEKHKWMVHAEVRTICTAAMFESSTADTTLYVTLVPCNICAMAIISAGITRVAWHQPSWHPPMKECHHIGAEMLCNARVITTAACYDLHCGTIRFDGETVGV